MKQWTYLLLIALISHPALLRGMDLEKAETLFQEAGAAYEAANYSEALVLYDSIANQYVSFELYFNAGNAAYRTGALGKSILYYERARKIDPADDDLRVNLAVANEKGKDRIQALPSLGVEDLWSVLTSSNQLSTWSALAVGLNLVGFILLAGWLWGKAPAIRRALFWTGTVLVLFGILGYMMSRATYLHIKAATEAVVLEPKVEIKNSPNSNDANAFLLHEGTKVKILQETDQWFEIRIANGNVGWMPRSAAEII